MGFSYRTLKAEYFRKLAFLDIMFSIYVEQIAKLQTECSNNCKIDI